MPIHTRRVALAFSALLLTLLPQSGQSQAITTHDDAGQLTVDVNWHLAQGKAKTRITSPRISAGTPLIIHTHHFNFLRYSLRVDVKEEAVESYRVLEKLWSQVLGIGAIAGVAGGAAPAFDLKIVEWRKALRAADQRLSAFLSQFQSVGLTDAEVQQIANGLQAVGTAPLAQLEKLHDEAYQLALVPDQMDMVEHVEAVHEKVVARLSAFTSAAQQTVSGSNKNIKGSEAGTAVTVALQAEDQNKADTGKPVVIEYFVQSKHPVDFHAGLSYVGIRQVDFQKVRALSGQDLYAKIKDQSGESDLSAFLSYPIVFGGQQQEHALLGSIGTTITDPGKLLSVGLSLRLFRKLYLTAGAASDEVSTGNNPVTESLANQAKSRELFDAITLRRKWGAYGAISFGVMP